MVAWRVGCGAALSLLLLAGCRREPPQPEAPSSQTSNSAAANSPPERSTGPGPVPSSDSGAASTGPATESPAETVANSAPTAAQPSPPEPPFELEQGFASLAFSDFESFGAEPATWEPTAEGVKCAGKPRGYLYSKQGYQNFTLRLDYRFPRPATLKDDTKFKGNTGFLVYVTGEHKLWPVCLEVQGKHVQMAAIKENGGAQPVTATDNEVARQTARRPVGQWNTLEIVSLNGSLSVELNGTAISTCEPNFLSDGLIGIQAEDHPFEVRRMRIRRE